ncbi:MAG: hypothetical protein FWE84_04510 [Firmicutes bacterium]|nr:hypothetical protein [Bacillota bacterium]
MAVENTQKRTGKRRRKNAFMRYFTPFGLRQLCDIVLFVAAIVVIVGLSIYEKHTTVVLIVGLSLFLAGALLAAYRSVRVLLSGINKRSPEYKAALVNAIIMGALTVLAVVGLIFCFV